ncbi:hypothetical protein RMN57_30685 [Kitasatospora sp. CM 4170]|uniref:DUF4267 domain-containing protein n=1 Tax=Kitasatospora aburaviensis TaxID=67265 RepID=A0ABW1ES18_9ACTN|nr:hypothetical protein [Kitasatospora sp. CM 4170]WNM48755.1 hypothetical protein RMN57_30685 [Kitasatospora sp. CM 4170]
MLRRSTLATTRGMRALAIANAAGAALSMASAVVGLLSPELALPGAAEHAGPLTELYVQAYVVRALPLGAALLRQLLVSRTGRGLVPLLLVAGAVQAGDAAIGLVAHNPGMTAGGAVLAVLHLGLAARLARTADHPTAGRTADPASA